ncbi:MAG TPA: class I SAM-dependent rRNA methyltransferase [Chthoniobacterales bacterium]|nr:class I SAM-dependent rRNA methyltransferase [Chthoniobacterales bacterium]
MAGIVVRPRARIFHGHDWVYGSDILKVFGEPKPGDVISIKDGQDRSLGSAIYNPNSQIVARRFSRRRQALDPDFFARRISRAIASREKLRALRNPGRIVWSESDGLPGLIIDRYGPHLALQTLTLAMDQKKDLIVEVANQLLSPSSIVERNEAPVRKAEGLPPVSGVLLGEYQGAIDIQVNGIQFRPDLLTGQKTGLYLDQLENYNTVAEFAGGRRVLDCFSNQGGFAIACAKAGAKEVAAVEINHALVEVINKNAELNGVAITAKEANVFDFLSTQMRDRAEFDLIILDPPSFTKAKESVNSARRGYKEIHLRALQLLSPEGFLATFSCSHHVSREVFLEIIVDASVDSKRHVRIVKSLSQPLDHPILPHIPETEYLKGFLLQALPAR